MATTIHILLIICFVLRECGAGLRSVKILDANHTRTDVAGESGFSYTIVAEGKATFHTKTSRLSFVDDEFIANGRRLKALKVHQLLLVQRYSSFRHVLMSSKERTWTSDFKFPPNVKGNDGNYRGWRQVGGIKPLGDYTTIISVGHVLDFSERYIPGKI